MRPTLRESLLARVTAVLFVTIASVFIASVYLEYASYKRNVQRTRQAYVASRRRLIRSEVDRVISYIDYKKAGIETRLRTSIKSRVLEAHAIATNIHIKNQSSRSENEIKQMIINALRPIQFNAGRSYYLIADLSQKIVLHPIHPDLEGQGIAVLQDQEGTYFLREASKIGEHKKEGYLAYRRPKPGKPGRNYLKESFFKVFEPYRWVIGTGEFYDDVEADIKAEVIDWVERIRFGDEGYIFAGRWDGRGIIGPAKGRNMWDISDANGVKIVQKMIAAAKSGGGFVTYVMPPFEGHRHSNKISYTRGVPEWRWYIGAGVYVDAIEGPIAALKKDLMHRLGWRLLLFAVLFILLAGSNYLFARRIIDLLAASINSLLAFFNTAKSGSATMNPEQQFYAEFVALAKAGNEMVQRRDVAERAFRQSELRYREIIEGTDNLVTEVDTEGRFTFVNETSRTVFGLAPLDCIGRKAFDFIHPDDRENTLRQFEQWVKNKVPSVTFENRQVSISGDVRDMLWTINFHFDADGEIVSIRSIARDITERKHDEKELKLDRDQLEGIVAERTEALERANENLRNEILERKRVETELRRYADAQSVLVREVNHRVKNNLSAIIGMLLMEQNRAKSKGLFLYLPLLQELMGRIGGLTTVHSLLTLSGWRPLEIERLCRQVVNATLHGLPLEKRIDVKISPSQARINSNQAHHLTMVIHELTTNTMKYALEGRQTATIDIRIGQSNNTTEIFFKDNGPGYPGHVLQESFVPASIGFELIRGITRRSLRGQVLFSNENGAATRIIFQNELVHHKEGMTQ